MNRIAISLLTASLVGPVPSAHAAASTNGSWIVSARPPGCALARTDAKTKIEILRVEGETTLLLTSDAYFTSSIVTYPIAITLDSGPPIRLTGPGSGDEHTVRVLPNESLTVPALLDRMGRAASMTVEEHLWSAKFELGGLQEALPKLAACQAREFEKDQTAQADDRRTCDRLIETILDDVGGVRTGQNHILHPLADIGIDCGAHRKPDAVLWRSGDGFPPAFLQLVERLAVHLTDRPAREFKGDPARCLDGVVGHQWRGKAGRHHIVSPDAPLHYDNTLTTADVTYQCSYIGIDRHGAQFWVGVR